MIIKIKKAVKGGVMEIEIEEKEEKDVLAKALFYLKPDYCGLCKSDNVIWDSNKAKDSKGDSFTYIKKFCLACKAQSTAGEYKDGGLFWKQWEIYQPKGDKKAVAQNMDVGLDENGMPV